MILFINKSSFFLEFINVFACISFNHLWLISALNLFIKSQIFYLNGHLEISIVGGGVKPKYSLRKLGRLSLYYLSARTCKSISEV
jgi:hypothetical protein